MFAATIATTDLVRCSKYPRLPGLAPLATHPLAFTSKPTLVSAAEIPCTQTCADRRRRRRRHPRRPRHYLYHTLVRHPGASIMIQPIKSFARRNDRCGLVKAEKQLQKQPRSRHFSDLSTTKNCTPSNPANDLRKALRVSSSVNSHLKSVCPRTNAFADLSNRVAGITIMQPHLLLTLAGFVSRIGLDPKEDKSEAGMPGALNHGLLKIQYQRK